MIFLLRDFFVKYSQGYALLSLWYCDIIYKKVKTQEDVIMGKENYECADLSDRAWSLYRNDSVYRKDTVSTIDCTIFVFLGI